MKGSSPLTRGKPRRIASRLKRTGLIPAHAGKTPPANTPRPANWAHPRSRGENVCQRSRDSSGRGSSPLTRGKRDMLWQQAGRTGLIPAHAGKTAAVRRRPGRVRAHPRSRGENSGSTGRTRRTKGSSPLTRGKPTGTWAMTSGTGLIPAHAGKTRTRSCRGWTVRAHPRSRGENMGGPFCGYLSRGSSPLTRGKQDRGRGRRRRRGLIPAHAGKT